MKNNVVLEKSKFFALKIIELYKYLVQNKEYVLSKQILKSGTSIGANIKEAVFAQSKADFYAKLFIALKEAGETEYWIELLRESKYIEEKSSNSLYSDCQEIIKLLVAITKSRNKSIN